MILTPKAKFLSAPDLAKRHHETVSSGNFQYACECAMLQFIKEAPRLDDPVGAAANYHRIVGAQEFLKVLLTLGEEPRPVTQAERSKINYNTEQEKYGRSRNP